MKRVRINRGKVGLIFRNGDFNRVLTQGAYWLFPFELVKIYDMSHPFEPGMELNILVKDDQLASMLDIVDVADNELAIQYINGKFNSVLTAGRYAFWKGETKYTHDKMNMGQVEVDTSVIEPVLNRLSVRNYLRLFRVESFEKGLLYVNDQFVKELDKGVHYFWKNEIPVSILKVDMRQQQVEVSGQELLSKDKAAVRVNFFATYKVVDAAKALTENKDFERQLYIILQMALREFIGSLTLDELLEKKD